MNEQTTHFRNGQKIMTKYGDRYTVNFQIDHIVTCYENNQRVHAANIIATIMWSDTLKKWVTIPEN